ncbi:MAG: acyl-coenzyme A thioesterase PaaI-like protein [Cocleimonas sp.]
MSKKNKFNLSAFASKYLNFISEERRMAIWPAWWMMRIKVTSLANDWREVRITLPLTWISKNAGGGMFGGFQASLADPIAPLACVKIFKGYDVWTRKLTVDFQRPGITDLELRFDFPIEKEQEIFEELVKRGRSTPTFEYGLYLQDGTLCTRVECVVAIREQGYANRKRA